ncbi:MAG: amidohydrolase family protein [Christensenellales bacterium]
MGRLVIKRLKAIVSCDANDTVYENADMLIEDNKIAYIGDMTDGIRRMGASMIDGRNMICYPGLINTHHHFYQYFSRNLPQVQNMELFDWLKTLYEIWKGIDREIVYCSSALAMMELMKWGCTTAFDHHYVFPKAAGHLLIRTVPRGGRAGHALCRKPRQHGFFKKDGGLPPDSVVQTVDEILEDSAALPRSITTLPSAPCARLRLRRARPFP